MSTTAGVTVTAESSAAPTPRATGVTVTMTSLGAIGTPVVAPGTLTAMLARGTFKGMVDKLPDVGPTVLEPLLAFCANTERRNSQQLVEQLASHMEQISFVVVRQSDNKIRILHLLGKYVCPLGDANPLSNEFVAFKGDRSQASAPPSILANKEWFKVMSVKDKHWWNLIITMHLHRQRQSSPSMIQSQQLMSPRPSSYR